VSLSYEFPVVDQPVGARFKKNLNEYEKKLFSLFQEIFEDCGKRTELPYNPDFTKAR
jgi:hypothetical protein